MPLVKSSLAAFEVKRIAETAASGTRHSVGGVSGLELQKSRSGSCSWVLRTLINGKRREIGLGSFNSVSLKDAREEAKRLKYDIRLGNDPVFERSQRRSDAKVAEKLELRFNEAVELYLHHKLKEFQNPKHRQQWRSTLSTYAAKLNERRVSEIDLKDILDILKPIWLSKTVTASRLRGRIEKILDWAALHGHRSGENPARWKGNLELTLQKPSALKNQKNQPALRLSEAASWYSNLRKRSGIASRALEFCALTAARSGEIRGAKWTEIENNFWIIPAERTKTSREHRIALSERAVHLLTHLPKNGDLIFPNSRGGQLSDAALSSCMKRIQKEFPQIYLDRESKRPAVPHGLRSTFSDWAAEKTEYPFEMAEIALGHKVGNATARAYRRMDMLQKRVKMMEDWSNFLEGKT